MTFMAVHTVRHSPKQMQGADTRSKGITCLQVCRSATGVVQNIPERWRLIRLSGDIPVKSASMHISSCCWCDARLPVIRSAALPDFLSCPP